MSLQLNVETRSLPEPDPDDRRAAAPLTSTSEGFQNQGGYTGHSAGQRSLGLILTIAVHMLVLGAFLINWGVSYVQQEVTTLSVFDVAPPVAPPEPESETPPGPEQVQQERRVPQPDRPKIDLPEIQIPRANSFTLPEIKPAPAPAPPVELTTAPEARPAPPAQQVSNAAPNWQGRVLAALNQKKRYPSSAQRRREQGIPWVRLVMNREGEVLSVALERSSGFRALDEEAMRLPRRAAPLPAPPDEVAGQTIELVVPIEFFMGAR